MTTGLEYQNNAAVSANPEVTTITNWYTIKSTPDTGDTITITFADGIPKDTVITITYSAKVTSDALSEIRQRILLLLLMVMIIPIIKHQMFLLMYIMQSLQ